MAEEVEDTLDIRLPPLKALVAFDAAARHGSFAKAADELKVTPSAISHQIQILEDFLGVQLFQRHAGRAGLTSAGKTFSKEIEYAFRVIMDATKVVAPQSQQKHFTIASGPSFAAKWLQPRLPEFLNSYPGLKVRLSTLSDTDDVDSGRFDIAITYGRPNTHRSVEPLLTERLRPFCSPKTIELQNLRAPADLARSTLIHSVNALSWAEYFRKIGVGDIRPVNEIWLDRSMMAIEAAVNGMGVVLESEILVAAELADRRLVPLFDDPKLSVETTSYYLVKAPSTSRSAFIQGFEIWLKAAVAIQSARSQ